MKNQLILLFIFLCMAGVLISGCTSPTTNPVTTNQIVTQTVSPTPTHAIPQTGSPAKTILSTANDDSRFKTLISAIQAAKLDGTLNGSGPFTVFAPSEDAFNKLPNGTVQSLMKDPEGQLKQILLYHVVHGDFEASDFVNVTTLQTLQGGDLTFKVVQGTLYVNNAKVTITDINTANGVIQVIDTVLIPPAPTTTTNTTNTTGM